MCYISCLRSLHTREVDGPTSSQVVTLPLLPTMCVSSSLVLAFIHSSIINFECIGIIITLLVMVYHTGCSNAEVVLNHDPLNKTPSPKRGLLSMMMVDPYRERRLRQNDDLQKLDVLIG